MNSDVCSASSHDAQPRTPAGLSLEQRRERNDAIRTSLRGAVILFTPEIANWPADFRGRLLYRLTLYQKFSDDSDHSEGVFVFAGYSIIWRIAEFAGQLSITLSTSWEDAV
jgi:hypothetical protein